MCGKLGHPAFTPPGFIECRRNVARTSNLHGYRMNLPTLKTLPTFGHHLPQLLLLAASALVLTACNKTPGTASAASAPVAERPLLIAPEDLRTLQRQPVAAGPAITGSIQPERKADLRAELSAVVLQVYKENGDAVRRGDLLVRLDDTAIRDGLTSADESVRTSTQAAEQAERQVQRLKTLQAQGMTSMQATEDAEVRRNTSQSDMAAAKARAVAARQQLQRTEVRAPFDGLVSERKVSNGDTAQMGKELLKVIDPKSMRFEGLVSADRINDVAVGQVVSFRVNGQAQQEFSGTVKRVDPAANPVTRQVEVLVSFAPGNLPKVTGLYAEGRIAAASSMALLIPEASLQITGDTAVAWRVKGDTVNKVAVVLGERDPRRGDYLVKSGLAEGDTVLRNPGTGLKDGQKIERRDLVNGANSPAVAPASAAKN
jgi:membrane fusion protein, multidrug efflux system